ncbi:MAG: B-box zinc finger protein [Deltaproteobacteria bacterium]|jgi:hypothetical protein
MQCKNHPDRRAEYFCASCGKSLCSDCAEEGKGGEYFCFQCAMLSSVSAMGTTIKDKAERSAEKRVKEREKKKWTSFRYFVVFCSVLILVMWGVILFGGEKPPSGRVDLANQPRVFLFMVDGAIKRYAHDEGNRYPPTLSDLVPKYLGLTEQDRRHLDMLKYIRDPRLGYLLSLAQPEPGQMKIVISPKGISYEAS